MKLLNFARSPLAFAAPLWLCLGASAAPVSFEFTAGEGFSDGNLQAQNNWSVFDSTQTQTAGQPFVPGTFAQVTDSAGSGTLVISTPPATGFQAATYTPAFTEDNYTTTVDFSLVYPQGSPATAPPNTNIPLPQFEFRKNDEIIAFAFRQTSGTTWNASIVDLLDGSTPGNGQFAPVMDLDDVGLSVDGSGNWDDNQSDLLRLVVSTVYLGNNQWQASLEVINVDSSTTISSIAQYIIDDGDDSFSGGGQQLRLLPVGLRQVPATVEIDRISVVVPEPASIGLIALGLPLVLCGRRS
jgi:hypothetical protein